MLLCDFCYCRKMVNITSTPIASTISTGILTLLRTGANPLSFTDPVPYCVYESHYSSQYIFSHISPLMFIPNIKIALNYLSLWKKTGLTACSLNNYVCYLFGALKREIASFKKFSSFACCHFNVSSWQWYWPVRESCKKFNRCLYRELCTLRLSDLCMYFFFTLILLPPSLLLFYCLYWLQDILVTCFTIETSTFDCLQRVLSLFILNTCLYISNRISHLNTVIVQLLIYT